MKLLSIIFIMISIASFSQNRDITVLDFVKINNNKKEEAIYFYENNWKLMRIEALRKGFIKSYKLLSIKSDSLANFDLILETVYKDSLQFELSEVRFQAIIKELNPSGPKLLNELKPKDFRQNVFVKFPQTLSTSEN